MPTSLTRAVTFPARHRYRVEAWTEEENRARFGGLVEPHQHDYRCEVTVAGPLPAPTGMLMDLGQLDRILAEEILGPFQNQDLNQAIPAVRDGLTQPTCEAIARHLYQRIASRLPRGVRLERVRVAEDSTLHADCTGIP
jgi:6-pyruvoyltetrahydropterin/6-carboxytetrahydropterin synthase